jgi:tripartite-type tricarboxylate transporter receptor subunit TctC
MCGRNVKHRLIRIAAAVFSALVLSNIAAAQPYPSKPITVLVGFSAGGATDGVARLISTRLSEKLKVPVLVENRPGAGQLLAIQALKSAAPDGYTLYLGSGSSLAQNPGVQKNLPFRPLRDFTLVALAGSGPGVMAVSNTLPVSNLKEFIDYAKKNPGKLNYGSSGIGSANHLHMEYFMARTGIEMMHIPYKADSAVGAELAAGRVHVSISTMQVIMPLVQAGRVKPLAVTSVKPIPFAPGVPSLAEAGVPGLDGLDPYTFYGFVGPAGLPRPIVNRLNEAINEAINSPDIAARMRDALRVEPTPDTPDGFRRFLENELAKWTELGKIIKISAD